MPRYERNFLRSSFTEPGTAGATSDLSRVIGSPTTTLTNGTTATVLTSVTAFTRTLSRRANGTSFPYSVDVTSLVITGGAGGTPEGRISMVRANSSGVTQETANGATFTTTGIKTGTLTLNGPWDTGHRLYLLVECRVVNPILTPTCNITVSVQDADSYADVPLTVPAGVMV